MKPDVTGTINSGNICGAISVAPNVSEIVSPGIGQGVSDYERLKNLPQIEGITLIGNKSFTQLNLSRLTNSELEDLLK